MQLFILTLKSVGLFQDCYKCFSTLNNISVEVSRGPEPHGTADFVQCLLSLARHITSQSCIQDLYKCVAHRVDKALRRVKLALH